MSPQNLEHQPVTAFISHIVRPGQKKIYDAWSHGINAAAREFEGNLGSNIIYFEDCTHPEYLVVIRFDCYDNLNRWLESDTRREWIKQLSSLIEKPENIQALTGLETWFNLPNQPPNPPPARYKMALVTWLGVFSLLTLLTFLIGPLLSNLPLLLHLFLSSGLMVLTLTYVLLPRLTRLFRLWLYPTR